MNKIKYIYFFRGDLSSHVGIYKSWVDVASDNLDISIITIIDTKTYTIKKKLVEYYRNKNIFIKVVPRYLKSIFTLLYFFYITITNDKVVVHLRKQSPKPLNIIKKLLPNKIKYIIEIEGDFDSEIEYLSQEKNKYKDGFYKNIVAGMKQASHILEQQFFKADGIFVVSNTLKELFISRYDKDDLTNKIYVIPTGFDNTKFFSNEKLRNTYRKKYNLEEKFVMIFTGNILYSWQNIKRSIEVFKSLKEGIYPNLYFLMLIRKEDHKIAQEFISKLNLHDKDYLLLNVSHEEVNGFLNASDLGILLRENNMLNKVASPGKLGEYLSAGLNVLTTHHIGNYSKKMQEDQVGILIDDIYDDNEIINKVKKYNSLRTKEEISKWASQNFSVQAYKQAYIDALQGV